MARLPDLARRMSRRSRQNAKSPNRHDDAEISATRASESFPAADRKLVARFNFVDTSEQSLDHVLASDIERSSNLATIKQESESLQLEDCSFPKSSKRLSFTPSRRSRGQSPSRRRSMVPDWTVHEHKRRSLTHMMCDAASTGDTPQVGRLLGAGADPRRKSKDGESPVHLAAAGGHLSVLKSLVMHGARLDVTDSHGRTPLHSAVLGRHSSVIPFLVSSGVPIDTKDVDGVTAINLAAQQSAEDSLQELNLEEPQSEKVRFSYNFGNPAVSKRASIASISSNHCTPLEALLQAGVTVGVPSNGTLPLDTAVQASELRNTSELLVNDSRSRL